MSIVEIEEIKGKLIDLMKKEPLAFKKLLEDVANESESSKELEILIEKNFKRFDKTFRALA